MAAERWVPIEGFSDYEVSDHGRVKHLSVVTIDGKHLPERILNGSPIKDGYLAVTLHKDKKQCTKTIHRLVAKAFISNTNNYPEVNHKDGDKRNNSASNLEWCDHSANMLHAYKHGLHKPLSVNEHQVTWNKLTEYDVIWIRENCVPNDKNLGINAMARKFGVAKATMRKAFLGLTWKSIT